MKPIIYTIIGIAYFKQRQPIGTGKLTRINTTVISYLFLTGIVNLALLFAYT